MGPLRLLLDTHTLHRGDPALSASAQAAIADSQNEKYISAITAWEFITKFRSGNQPEFAGIAAQHSVLRSRGSALAGFGAAPQPVQLVRRTDT